MSWTQVTEEEVKEIKEQAAYEAVHAPLTDEPPTNLTKLLKAKAEVNKKKVLKAKTSVLEEAQTIIYGDREKTYGHPAKNLKTIANMWTAYMNNMDDGNFTITAKDVAAMMMLVKVARFANDPTHRDNLVDVCGYAALIERCDEVSK
jgi:aminopeptidase-like protein